jgi:hypothetical protein
MNKEIYTNNNSTNNLQQKADGCGTTCTHSWNSIYNNFHPVRRLPSVTICMILISFLFFTGYVNTKKSGSTINSQVQPQSLSDQHTKTSDSFTTELSSEVKENNMGQQTFMQITILSNN